MTPPATWRASLESRADLIEALNSIELPSTREARLIRNLIRALARGGGAVAERAALDEALANVDLRLHVGENGLALGARSELSAIPKLLIDLLAAAFVPAFQLRRCFNDGLWFSPALRSARSKFCSQRCRNRFNYEMREQEARFVCAECGNIREIDAFSGLGLEDETPEPADVHTPEPLCVECVISNHPEWSGYVNVAELIRNETAPSPLSTNGDYTAQLRELIKESFSKQQGPQTIKGITKYVTQRTHVRGRRPELTILGHLLRFPTQYRKLKGGQFALVDEPAHESRRGAKS